MMWDEQQLREALREEINGPAPSVQTELSDIMPRGLRRRRFRQASSVAAAVAVVAGIGAVAMTFGGTKSVNEPAQETVIPTVAPRDADWSRADLPPFTPHATWTPQPGAPELPGVPKTGLPRCAQGNLPAGYPTLNPAEMPRELQDRLVGIVRSVAAPAKVGSLMSAPPPQYSDNSAYQYFVNMDDDNGPGSVRFYSQRSPLPALATADFEAFSENNCPPPKRVTKPDGTILQIYQIRPTDDAVTQSLSIYLPDRRVYRVMAQSYPYQPSTTGAVHDLPEVRRKTLPLTEYQLSRLGEALVR
jgi:hypothetical protein